MTRPTTPEALTRSRSFRFSRPLLLAERETEEGVFFPGYKYLFEATKCDDDNGEEGEGKGGQEMDKRKVRGKEGRRRTRGQFGERTEEEERRDLSPVLEWEMYIFPSSLESLPSLCCPSVYLTGLELSLNG